MNESTEPVTPLSPKPEQRQAFAPIPKFPSAFDLLTPSSEIAKKYLKLFILVNIPMILLNILSSVSDFLSNALVQEQLKTNALSNELTTQNISLIVAVATAVCFALLVFGIMNIALQIRAIEGEKPTFSSLLSESIGKSVAFIGLFLAATVIITAGLIALIVPGIFAIVRLMYAPYILINENVGPIEAIKRSNCLAKKYSGPSWGVFGVSLLVGIMVGIIGIVPIVGAIVGSVVGILYGMVVPMRYLELKKLDQSASPAAPPPPILG